MHGKTIYRYITNHALHLYLTLTLLMLVNVLVNEQHQTQEEAHPSGNRPAELRICLYKQGRGNNGDFKPNEA